jgi:hypothetical protein
MNNQEVEIIIAVEVVEVEDNILNVGEVEEEEEDIINKTK